MSKHFYKFLPNTGKYAILNPSLKVVKEVKSLQEAHAFLDNLEKQHATVKGFGDHTPNFILRSANG